MECAKNIVVASGVKGYMMKVITLQLDAEVGDPEEAIWRF